MSRLYLLQQRLFTCNCEIIVSYTHHGRYSHSDVLVSKNRTIINSYSRLPLAVALLVVCPEPARPHCHARVKWRERVRKGTCIAFQTAYDNENRNTPNKQHFQWEIRGMVWSMELLTGDKQSECKCNCVTLIVYRDKGKPNVTHISCADAGTKWKYSQVLLHFIVTVILGLSLLQVK